MSFGQSVISNISFYSYSLAWLAYALLSIGVAVHLRNRTLSLSVIICIVLTSAWGGVIALSTIAEHPLVKLVQTAEAARNASWMFLLHSMYGVRLRGANHFLAYRQWLPWYAAGIALVLIHLFALPLLLHLLGLPESLETDLNFVMWLGFSLAMLVMVEQIYRLSTEDERWVLKYLCLGLCVISGYDFLMYAQALMLRHLDPVMWQARGAVVTFAAPLLAMAVLRSRRHLPDVPLSRHVVFHTLTLLVAGLYLIYMAAAGYAIHYFGGTWGGVAQVTFLSVSGLIFIVLVLSSRVRDRVRVWLSKHFFSYRYDYRREWLDFTHLLAQSADATPRAVTRAMANLCGSPGGLLWTRIESGGFVLADCWSAPSPGSVGDLTPLSRWLEQRLWIVDFDEWRHSPALYQDLEMPEGMAEIPQAWLIVPLMFGERLQGLLLLLRPAVVPDMNWEDRDLLKVAGRAAATHLAQYQASQALVESRQFEAFNRLSAYVVHDLKNILAQQSLIVFNAEHCRSEPGFLDDVVETISNSVERMSLLMAQMRSGVRGETREFVSIGALLRRVVASRSRIEPQPTLEFADDNSLVEADGGQLESVFGHLIQNAQEACHPEGCVTIRVTSESDMVRVEIRDSGCGMDEQFVAERLFKPFDTTKGLTSMGIGAYESREYVRRLGGEIHVWSRPGIGSWFSVLIPAVPATAITMMEAEVVSGD